MKTIFIKIINLLSRIYDLIIKLISVKGVFFGTMLYLAIVNKDTLSISFAFSSGAVFVGGRAYNKYLDIKKI